MHADVHNASGRQWRTLRSQQLVRTLRGLMKNAKNAIQV
jgi:hypothetical protein